nr:hypothetical protein HmN_000993800 [Hymenolepis microstoma]
MLAERILLYCEDVLLGNRVRNLNFLLIKDFIVQKDIGWSTACKILIPFLATATVSAFVDLNCCGWFSALN